MADKHEKKDDKHKDDKKKEEKKPKDKKEKKDKAKKVALVTGVSGNTGGATLKALLAHEKSKKWVLRAGSRDPAKAKEKLALSAEDAARVEFVVFDGDKDDVMAAAFAGVTATVLVLPQAPDGRGLALKKQAEAALKAGVQHIVTLTAMVLEAADSVFGKAMAGWKEFTETAEAKPKITDLRLNFFLENFWGQKGAIQSQDSIYLNLPKGTYSHISVQDIGAFTAGVLLKGKKHTGKVYYPSGHLRETLSELAAAVGRGVGREIKGVPVPEAAVIQSMQAFVPEFVAKGSANLNELADAGFFKTFEDTWQQSRIFNEVVGRDPITTEAWFKQVAHAFAKI